MPNEIPPREAQSVYTASDTDVFAAEMRAIASRRSLLTPPVAGMEGLVGLALSGGGIRSASFSLGVLQALDTKKVIQRIDYLSTVSGGGYIGCCLTACMTKSGGAVPFNEESGYGDTDAIQHIRDFSNYLVPRGFRDLVVSFGLIGRGLAANIILLAPFFWRVRSCSCWRARMYPPWLDTAQSNGSSSGRRAIIRSLSFPIFPTRRS